MDENTPPPLPAKGSWWFGWILATAVIPGLALAVLPLLPENDSLPQTVMALGGIGALGLHILSSVKLGKGRSGGLVVGLIFGGWALMLASFFVGCLALVALE
ncbi:MAG TPA: hypothetical protein PLB55_04965 [Prosthecobacter sp.]|jgi:hypothetical protein|nr:hypothetical protein [Prosthecobacter sp.]